MYEVKIIESTRELTKREEIRIKDFSSFSKLKDIPTGEIIENVTGLFFVHVVNDKSDSGEYDSFVIEQARGENYISTGSIPFYESLKAIIEEFIDDESGMPEEQIDIQVTRFPSKNNAGEISKAVLV